MLTHTIDQELDLARASGPARTLNIPPCPDLLVRLQQVMRSDDPDWDEISEIASADVAMAASLVRAANSPMYARSSTASSVDQAMSLLGLRQTSALLTQFLTARALPINHPALEHFWLASSRRAMTASYIARQLYGVQPDLAHTCGLFCDVGIPILLQGMRGYAGTLVEARARRDRGFTETENAAHRTDHTVVGALVARAWRLPTELKYAIRLHHDISALRDPSLDETVRNLIAICRVADHIVLQHEGNPPSMWWEQQGQECLDHLHIHADEVVLWQDALADPLAQLA